MRIGSSEPTVRGYTLIEVLVAMMILSMALVVLMRIFSTGLTAVRTSADYAGAVVLAEARLAAAGVSAPLTVGDSEGQQDRYTWRQVVAPYAPDGSAQWPVPAYQVDVRVEWPGSTGTRGIGLTTIKLERPAGIAGAGRRPAR